MRRPRHARAVAYPFWLHTNTQMEVILVSVESCIQYGIYREGDKTGFLWRLHVHPKFDLIKFLTNCSFDFERGFNPRIMAVV